MPAAWANVSKPEYVPPVAVHHMGTGRCSAIRHTEGSSGHRPHPVGPPARQIDDAEVKPAVTRRTLRITFASVHTARKARSALADVAHADLQTGPTPALLLTVDSSGMRRVRTVLRELGGQIADTR